MSEENGKQLQAAPGSQSRQDLTSTGAIREFMLRVVAWPLNGEPGYINLEYQVKNPQREKPIWISKSVKQIDEFLILTKQKSNEKTAECSRRLRQRLACLLVKHPPALLCGMAAIR